ncbi:MAG: hypothetical protein K8U57_37625 [Planctomycetes bacterium]|nr:hypothetical protein [Planctomycetota bacterium]
MTRLLVIVLTLVGPLPFRTCTCAATPTTCSDPSCPTAPKVKSCSCGHHHDSAEEAESTQPTVTPVEGVAASHTHPPEHQSGCPTVQPRPADAMGQIEARDVPPEAVPESIAAISDPFFSTRHPVGRTVPDRRMPSNPLFITLPTLRN